LIQTQIGAHCARIIMFLRTRRGAPRGAVGFDAGLQAGSPRWLAKPLLISAVVACGLGSASAGSPVELRHSVVAGGGGTVAAGPYRLSSSIGEPAAGPTSAEGLTLTSGFLATFVSGAGGGGPGGGTIFRDGFESTSN
jgi:hypothetical protein